MGGRDFEISDIKLLIEATGMNEIIHGDKAKPRIIFQEHQHLKVRYKVPSEIAAKEGQGKRKTDITKVKGRLLRRRNHQLYQVLPKLKGIFPFQNMATES